MRSGRNLGWLLLALLVVAGGSSCKKRKPPLPTQSNAPTINKPTVPPVASQPLPTPPTVTAEPPQPSTSVPTTTTAKKTRLRRRKPATPPANTVTSADAKPNGHKPATGENPPGDSNVQISAEVPQPAANLRRQQTEGLLQSAEWNLKRVNRTLTDGEESMQRQVRNFITQSRLAIQDGDLERAFNLATKANLLSQELAK